MASLPISDIKHLIPQKAPFEMVDTLLDYSEKTLTSAFTIKATNIFVEEDTFKESGLIENMAQTVALHTGYSYFLKGEKAPTGYIGSIKTIRVNQLPRQGDTIITTANILHEFNGVTMVDVVVKLNSVEIASGQMKTVIAQQS